MLKLHVTHLKTMYPALNAQIRKDGYDGFKEESSYERNRHEKRLCLTILEVKSPLQNSPPYQKEANMSTFQFAIARAHLISDICVSNSPTCIASLTVFFFFSHKSPRNMTIQVKFIALLAVEASLKT